MKDILKKITIGLFIISLVFINSINASASFNNIANTIETIQNNDTTNTDETDTTNDTQENKQVIDEETQTQDDESNVDKNNQTDEQTQKDEATVDKDSQKQNDGTTVDQDNQNNARSTNLVENLNGKTFILTNVTKKYILTATPIIINGNLNGLDGMSSNNIEYVKQNNGYYKGTTLDGNLVNSCVKWTFELVPNSTNEYYIHTVIDSKKKYLTIDSNNNEDSISNSGNITLSDTKNENSKITVNEGEGSYAGQIRLTNKNKMAINLYGEKSYFAGWYDSGIATDKNNYFYLVSTVEHTGVIDNTVTPSGTSINLFDYWVKGERIPSGSKGDKDDALEEGINKNHALKFTSDGFGENNMNKWVGAGNLPYFGIVKNTLENGYPVLTEASINAINGKNGYGSNTYQQESLAYLFDPKIEHNNKVSYQNVGGLLQLNKQGYYYYDCKKNYAEFDEKTNKFTLYDRPGINKHSNNSITGQFFPYNNLAESITHESGSAELNHYFGLTLTSRFIQQYDGFTDGSKQSPTKFEFSGDDDVWIFIDGVLVADLGGIHDAAFVSIDFSTGEVIIKVDGSTDKNKEKTTTLRQAFQNAGKENDEEWDTTNSNIFANNTYHTLKFFYLERGSYDSNMTLKYNLQNYPPLGIFKVNQYGDRLAGAKFAIYPANNDYKYLNNLNGSVVDLTPSQYHYDNNGNICSNENDNILVPALYCGTTNSNGEMVFVDQDDMPYSMKEIKSKFGEYFILKEIECPKGYRYSNLDIQMEIRSNALTCNNSYETGVYASPTVQMVAPNKLKLNGENELQNYYQYNADGDTVHTEGTLFAVVLKYSKKGNTSELSNQKNWAPVYGRSQEGYTVINVDNCAGNSENEKFISAAIEAARNKSYEGKNVFTVASSGQMEASLSDLPGRIWYYYWMLKEGNLDLKNTEYTLAFYWTTADSLDQANSTNTYRVDDKYKDDKTSTSYEIIRTFGANIEVPNLLNRVLVQKTDDNNTLVNGATFAMYEVYEAKNKIYYKTDNNQYILLKSSERNFNEGNAWLKDQESDTDAGSYEVNNSTGVITATINGNTYTINPARDEIENDSLLCTTTTKENNKVGEDGTAFFSGIVPGKYYIREIKAPDSYRLNSSEVMVYVTNDAICANAGQADDGITVGRGPGYLVHSMQRFASIGDINNTLSWLYSVLKISGESTTFDTVNATDYKTWQYSTRNYINQFDDTTAEVSEALTAYIKYAKGTTIFNYDLNSDRTHIDGEQNIISSTRRLVTDIGWSYLEIYQDHDYGSQMNTAAHYDDLSNTELSHLFSRSVYVRVSDQPEKLKIKKVDETNHESVLRDAKFKLKRVANNTTYYAKVIDGNITWKTTKEEQTTLETDKNGCISILSGLYDGEYTLTETLAPDGYAMLDNDRNEISNKETHFTIKHGVISGVDVQIEKSGNDVTSVITIENAPKKDFEFTKINKNREELEGAEFILYELTCNKTDDEHTSNHNTLIEFNEDGEITNSIKSCYRKVKEVTSTSDGKVIFNDTFILDKKYRLVETKIPNGYAVPGGQWEICISLDDEGQSVVTITAIGHPPAFELNEGHYSLVNYTPVELPLSGYPGIIPMIIAGSIMIIIAILWSIRKHFIKTKRT